MASPADWADKLESAEKMQLPSLLGLLLPPYGLGIVPWEESAGNAVPTRALANTIRWFVLWTKRSTCFLILRS